ncbi:MAG: LppX_LprAFG lipoprotein [Dehalococcoidia bacterium]|nr:LppX_LprAFG lipoprotein [Dehalococcoidia bacterium]
MSLLRIIRLLAGLVLLVGLAVTIAACGDDSAEPTTPPLQTPQLAPTPLVISVTTPVPTSTPSSLTAAEILRETTAAMRAVQSAHIEMAVTTAFEGDNSFASEIGVSGDFQKPDHSQAVMSLKSRGITVEIEFISIGAESYIKNPLTGEWEANLGGVESFGNILAGPAFETDFPEDREAKFELVGIESLDGEDVFYLRAQITGAELADLIDDESVYTGVGEVSYWIGVNDFLVRKVEILAEQESEGIGINAEAVNLRVNFVIALSNYNQDVDIVAPEVSGSFWEGLDGAAGTYESPILVTIGEAVEGNIEVEFQEVVYEFEAEDTAGYLIDVSLGTLPFVDVTVFDSEGNDVGWGGVYEDGTEEPIELDVPFPETHYIVVSNYEGGTGTYTLTITPLDDGAG